MLVLTVYFIEIYCTMCIFTYSNLCPDTATCEGTLQYDCYGGSGEGGEYGWVGGNSVIFGGNLLNCHGIVVIKCSEKKCFKHKVFFC